MPNPASVIGFLQWSQIMSGTFLSFRIQQRNHKSVDYRSVTPPKNWDLKGSFCRTLPGSFGLQSSHDDAWRNS